MPQNSHFDTTDYNQNQTKLPAFLKWPVICILYVLFAFLPVIPIILTILRLKFNKKHPQFDNNGFKKTICFLVGCLIVVFSTAMIFSTIENKKYNETLAAIENQEFETALELLNKNYPDPNDGSGTKLWFEYYCGLNQFDTAADLYFTKIENANDILDCENYIQQLSTITKNLSDSNKTTLNNYQQAYADAKTKYEESLLTNSTSETTTETLSKSQEQTHITEAATTASGTNESLTTTQKDKNEDIITSTTVVTLSEEDKETVKTWIRTHLRNSNIKTKDIKTVKKVSSEDQFFSVWKESYISQLKYKKATASDFEDYCTLYKQVWPSSTKTSPLNALISEFADAEQLKAEIDSKIGYNTNLADIKTQTFYISQKLKYNESDIEKFINSIIPREEQSQWVAYNVEYSSWGKTIGNTKYILSLPANQAFTQAGYCDLYYIQSSQTVDVVDDRGFESTLPVCLVLDYEYYEISNMITNRYKYERKLAVCKSQMKSFLETGTIEEYEISFEKYLYTDMVPDDVFVGTEELVYTVRTDGTPLNLRSGCGSDYSVIDQIPDGTDVLAITSYSGWFYIVGHYGTNGYLEGNKGTVLQGWVKEDYLTSIIK